RNLAAIFGEAREPSRHAKATSAGMEFLSRPGTTGILSAVPTGSSRWAPKIVHINACAGGRVANRATETIGQASSAAKAKRLGLISIIRFCHTTSRMAHRREPFKG